MEEQKSGNSDPFQSEKINELAGALAKFQGDVTNIPKESSVQIPTKSGNKINFKYADLAKLIETVKPHLSKYELSFSQRIQTDGRQHMLVTMLMHSSGQWMKSIINIEWSGIDEKSLGTKITYYRRYSLGAILGVAADDDIDAALDDIPENQKKAIQQNGQKKQQTSPQIQSPTIIPDNGNSPITQQQIKTILEAIGTDQTLLKDLLSNCSNDIKTIKQSQFKGCLDWIKKQKEPKNAL